MSQEPSAMETLDRLLEEGRISSDDYNDLRASMARKDTPRATPKRESERPPLVRVGEGAELAGVCTGLARHFNTRPAVVRLLFVIAGLLLPFGKSLGLLTYTILALCLPSNGQTGKRLRWSTAFLTALISVPFFETPVTMLFQHLNPGMAPQEAGPYVGAQGGAEAWANATPPTLLFPLVGLLFLLIVSVRMPGGAKSIALGLAVGLGFAVLRATEWFDWAANWLAASGITP